MDIVKPEFGAGFYVLSIVVSGVLFFLWRRLFRKKFTSEAVIIIGTAIASIITTPIVLLAILWLLTSITKH
jgi:hypothetical protein